MLRNVIAILLVFIFMLIPVMPTVIIVLDDSFDVSMLYPSAEEEKEKNKEKECIIVMIRNPLETALTDFEETHLEYYFRSYQKPHIKLNFPPPKRSSFLI